MVFKLPLLIITSLSPERDTLHPHSICSCVWLYNNGCYCHFPLKTFLKFILLLCLPHLRLSVLKLHLSGMALNEVPSWILRTDLIGKWILHLEKAERGEEGEKITLESYNHIHFLNRRMNIRFYMPVSKIYPKGREIYVIIFPCFLGCSALIHQRRKRERKN